MKIPPNRAVAFLTPLVFAPLAGAISVAVAKYSGMEIDEQALEAIFIAGATIATAKAGLWLKGWQDWEKTQAAAAPADEPVESAPDPEGDEEDVDGGFEEAEEDLEEDIPEEDEVPVAA